MKRLMFRVLVLLCAIVPAIAQAASTITYYHNDLLGSPQVATNAAGQVIWRESYRPYGERLTNDPASTANKVWYTSRRQDAESGLVYMGARFYDPVVGRFLATDPVAFDQKNIHSFNRYAYANNNPYRFSDRDGKAPTPVDVAFVAIDAIRVGYAWATGGDVKGAAIDLGISAGAIIIPIPGAALIIKAERAGEAARAVEHALPEGALVCRGGTCGATQFANGSGVTVDAAGKLNGVSVNSGVGKSLEELSAGIPNKQVGTTTVGDIRKAGGDVVPSPTANNPNHCTMCGITPAKAEELFTPTVRNPNVP